MTTQVETVIVQFPIRKSHVHHSYLLLVSLLFHGPDDNFLPGVTFVVFKHVRSRSDTEKHTDMWLRRKM
jgi:hypothetical protein